MIIVPTGSTSDGTGTLKHNVYELAPVVSKDDTIRGFEPDSKLDSSIKEEWAENFVDEKLHEPNASSHTDDMTKELLKEASQFAIKKQDSITDNIVLENTHFEAEQGKG